MVEETLHITNPQSYRKQNCPTKKVTLPTGSVFEIKLITSRDTLRECSNLGIKSLTDVSMTQEQRAEAAKSMSAEDRKKLLELNDKVIVMAVVSPIISLDMQECKTDANILHISDIADKDYYALLGEIQKMRAEASGIDLESFRKEQPAVSS